MPVSRIYSVADMASDPHFNERGLFESVEIDEDEALALGWDLVQEDVADASAGWPQHDPIKLGRVLATMAQR